MQGSRQMRRSAAAAAATAAATVAVRCCNCRSTLSVSESTASKRWIGDWGDTTSVLLTYLRRRHHHLSTSPTVVTTARTALQGMHYLCRSPHLYTIIGKKVTDIWHSAFSSARQPYHRSAQVWYGMACTRCQGITQFSINAHEFIRLAFLAEAGSHLPNEEGWKAF